MNTNRVALSGAEQPFIILDVCGITVEESFRLAREFEKKCED